MNATSERPLSIFLVAGEESGDVLGGALARALLSRAGGMLTLGGVGGRAMSAAGITSLLAIDALSIIGVRDVARGLPKILRAIRSAADAVIAARPDALVVIDSPDFTHRVARRVRRFAPGIPILDYVSPSVWAWRPGRARAMRSYIDCVLAILPFEPAVHRQLGGPPCVYVGHPLIERLDELRPGPADIARRQSQPPLLAILPGSRVGEVRRLLAIFGATIGRLAAQGVPVELVLPTVPQVLAQVRAETASWPLPPRIVLEATEKRTAFRQARAALAASGTVTLELALAGVPTVAAYRVPLVDEFIARALRLHTRLSSIILANLVLGRNVVPEFLQRDCTPAHLAAALAPLFADTAERQKQTDAFAGLSSIMSVGDLAPSDKAAGVVLDLARRGRSGSAALKHDPEKWEPVFGKDHAQTNS